MFIAMNAFRVVKGREADFEAQWRNRQSYLQGVPGFIQFALLKGEGEGEYISHTIWRDREAFEAWTRSPAFAAGLSRRPARRAAAAHAVRGGASRA